MLLASQTNFYSPPFKNWRQKSETNISKSKLKLSSGLFCSTRFIFTLCPAKSLLSPWWFMTCPEPLGIWVVDFFSGLLNMSERACQAIITDSKTEKEINLWQTSGLGVAYLWAWNVTLGLKGGFDYMASGFTNMKTDIKRLQCGGLSEH